MLRWRDLGKGMWTTDLISAAPSGVVLDLFALTTSPWATALSSVTVVVTVSSLDGSQVLVLEAGSVIGPDETTVVGCMSEEFVERHRTGTDLVLVQKDDAPDKVYSSDGGQFIVSAEISTPHAAVSR